MTDGGIRVRAVVADNYRVLLAVCLVASVLAGVVAADVAEPETTEVSDQRTLYEPTASVSHGADVVTETEAYGDVDRLEERPIYFANVSPVISGTITVGHRGDATVNTTVETAVVLRAVEGDGDAEGESRTVYWERRFQRNATSRTLDGGDRLQVPYAVNATEQFDRVDRIQSELDSTTGRTEVFLLATVSRSGQVDGHEVAHTERLRVRFTGDGSAVSVEPTGLDASPVTVTERRSVTQRADGPVFVATVVGTGVVWLVTLGLLAAGVAARRSDTSLAPTEAERARARFDREREEFDEWITAGTLPDSVRDRSTVAVESLSGLVDVAIDTGSRVIESAGDGRFYVPHDDLCYVYEPPSAPAAPAHDDVLAPASDDATPETDADGDEPPDSADGLDDAATFESADGDATDDATTDDEEPGVVSPNEDEDEDG